MKIFNKTKKNGSFGFKSCKEMAEAIIDNLDYDDKEIIEKIELAPIGNPNNPGYYLNIYLRTQLIAK